nr:hypothetical protein [Parafrankia discariae]
MGPVVAVVGAVQREVAQGGDWASIRLSQLEYAGVWAISTLLVAAHAPTRPSTRVDRCGA